MFSLNLQWFYNRFYSQVRVKYLKITYLSGGSYYISPARHRNCVGMETHGIRIAVLIRLCNKDWFLWVIAYIRQVLLRTNSVNVVARLVA